MNKINNILKKQKSIPIDQFINIALYEKKSGYYMKKNPFGNNGDFITSPLISNLFCEMIGIWCVAFWEHLGKPKKIFLAELGPGDASLCENLLNTFKNFKDFYKCVEIKLLEKSDKLQTIQKSKIKNKKVNWIKEINELKKGPIIFLGNEFFDAMPIKQIHKKRKLLFEKHVSLSKDMKKIEFIYKKANKTLIKKIQKLNLINREGDVIEYPIAAIECLKLIAKKIEKFDGALLSFDYGYTKKKNINTLQSVKNHKYINILSDPGNSDITHHINYSLFKEILKKNKMDVKKIVTQSEFLQKMGILERANILMKNTNFKTKINLFYRLKKLLHYQEMGALFKVMLAQKKKNKFSLGF